MKVLLIGASDKPERYSYKAINMLTNHNHSVTAVSIKKGSVAGIEFVKDIPKNEEFDTVTLYINPKLQEQYYQEVIDLKPRRVIFNPGTENEEFQSLLKENNIEPVEACTLVMLTIGTF